MLQGELHNDECIILIKAQPHRSSKYFETVCCAGIGRDQKWRRQYPVPFRILGEGQRFKRWSWISYRYTKSDGDKRLESQKVVPESLNVGGHLKKGERANFLAPLVRASFAEADARHESLTLIRPRQLQIYAEAKTQAEIDDEAAKHRELANQLSLLDNSAVPLVPCRMRFRARWTDQDGKSRNHECDDWETYAAYNRFEMKYGQKEAIEILKKKYEDDYFRAGLVLGFSTHKRRNVEFGSRNQWLLVGLIRLDETQQRALAI